MRVTPSVPITPAKLSSSSADAVFNPAAYSAGTTYDYGDIIKVAADSRIYESLENSNTGHTPSTSPLWWKAIGYIETAWDSGTNYAIGATATSNQRVYLSLTGGTNQAQPVPPETENEDWIDVGPMNRYAMFDIETNVATVWTSPLTVTFAPGQRINTIGFSGLSGQTLTISATSILGGGTVYGPVEVDLTYREVLDGYQYCYAPFQTRPYHVQHDLPPFSDMIVTVTVEATVGNVKIGTVVVGQFIELGDTERSSTNEGKSLSTTDRDRYGKATMNKIRSIPITSHRTLLPIEYVDRAIAARDDLLDATTALWTGINDAENRLFGMHQAIGFHKRMRFSDQEDMADHVILDIELEHI